MFNLEREINNWKKSLRKHPSLEDGYIEELEQHLRDSIEANVNIGMGEDTAFNEAVKIVGEETQLSSEYYKSDTTNKFNARPSWQAPGWMPILLWNYLKVALRNFNHYKGYSLINISGLAVGFTCLLIIGMLVHFELSYDKFHTNAENIYRVYTEANRPSGLFTMAPVPFPMGPAIENEVPEIKRAVRISEKDYLFSNGDNQFYESVEFVDKNFLDVFSFNLIKGFANEQILSEPNSVVISEKVSEKYFGDEDPIGKTFLVDNKHNFKVTGVVENKPGNSSIPYNILGSINTLENLGYKRINNWNSYGNDYLFLLLNESAKIKETEHKINTVMDKYLGDSKDRFHYRLQPIKEIHFSNFNYDLARTIPPAMIYVLGIIGFFIILIACFNFINLSTARAAHRSREIGIRKVVGANRIQLIKQFLGEAFLTTLIAFLFAIAMARFFIPEINSLLRTGLSLKVFGEPVFIGLAALILLLTALLAGGYPALVLSNYKPAGVLKNLSVGRKKGYSLRAALVTAQFAIAVFLITGTLTVYSQIDFVINKDLGFIKDRSYVLRFYDKKITEKGSVLKNSILQIPDVVKATFSSGTPASNTTDRSNFNPVGGTKADEQHLQILEVDYDFFDTYGFEVIEGRKFSKEYISDSVNILLNETAAKKFGWESVLGKFITPGDSDTKLKIIGKVNDFHYSSLRENIWPIMLRLNNNGNRFLTIQLSGNNTAETVQKIKDVYSAFSPNYPVDSFFINESFERYYRVESVMGKMLTAFTMITIFISCIGILGLASFTVERKSKEIGIRKVIGVSVTGIILMISKEFIKWILIANVIVLPLAYLAMNSWLNNFAYRVEFNYAIFGMTFCISLIVTVITVGYHSARAAFANPVEALKYE